jgi:peptide/nickel transport system substrate-binding protein
MKNGFFRPLKLLGLALFAAIAPIGATLVTPVAAQAQELKGARCGLACSPT